MTRSETQLLSVKYWEIIARSFSAAGWSWGCVSAVDSGGRVIYCVDACNEGRRFIARSDEKLTAFMELQSAIRRCAERRF
jgi:hypothetical protein